jgi:glycosyltransferase involved in cell wall biosynthesis
MRILHLLASPVFSGPAEVVAELALAQRSLGHEVTVAVDRRRTLVSSEEPAAARLRSLGLLDDGGLALSVKSPPFELWNDARRLRAMRPDVVHSHFTHDHLLAWMARSRGVKLVRSLHAPRSIRRLMPGADAWTVPSKGDLVRLGRTPAAVLPAVAAPSFRPPADRAALRRELGLDGAPLVGMVSTFQQSRRHDLALEAFATLKSVHQGARLLLVGDGETLPVIREQAKKLGLAEAVTFAGYRSGGDFVRHLQALDVVWILGLGNDWGGRAAVQARACGVRVVAVDAGALPDWADAVVPREAGAVASATVAQERRWVSLPSGEEVARGLVALYEA